MIMFRKCIEIYKNLISVLKPLWITHIAAFGVYSFELLAVFYIIYLQTNNIPSTFIEIFFIHYVLFMLGGEIALILVCVHFVIKLIFKKNFITYNNFLINNKIYHKFWLVGILIATIAVISITLWFIYLLSEELPCLWQS